MINYNPFLTRFLVEQAIFESDPFCLVDVGASGGIANYWRIFGKSLVAIGFEPLLAECERLNAQEPLTTVQYLPYFVGYEDYEKLLPSSFREDRMRSRPDHSLVKSSSVRAMELLKMNYVQQAYNQGKPLQYTKQSTSLDKFFAESDIQNIDFIKIDTDGSDYQVLLGVQETLKKQIVLGLSVESQFHGFVHDHANLFCNIDRFLRHQGFSLFDLETFRYTRADLPGKFCSSIPAHTTTGPISYGEALYFRNAGSMDYDKMWRLTLSPTKLLKLACLFEIHGLPDCAAELIVNHIETLETVVNTEYCLNLLAAGCQIMSPTSPPTNYGLERLVKDVQRTHQRFLTFTEYNELFDNQMELFFPKVGN